MKCTKIVLQVLSCFVVASAMFVNISCIIDDLGKRVNFPFNSKDIVETTVADFCMKHNMRLNSCVTLMKDAIHVGNMENVHLTESGLAYSHLERNQESFLSEILNRFRASYARRLGLTIEDEFDYNLEEEINNLIFKKFLFHDNSNNRVHRVCFIHSCLPQHLQPDVLMEMIGSLVSSTLLNELDHLWILNYGKPVELLFSKDFPSTLSKKITLIQRSSDMSRFEIPTIRHILQFVRRVISANRPVGEEMQVLYLHTKGVSYAQTYPQIQDWRRMMLYFLVEKHESCCHLLASGEFDVVGSNYISKPRHFEGNMWWVSGSYLASLPLLSSSGWKYAAERWLLNAPVVRIFELHYSGVAHATDRYPRQDYSHSHIWSPLPAVSGRFTGRNDNMVLCKGQELFWVSNDLQ